MGELSYERLGDALADETARFAALVDAAAGEGRLGAPVVSCPGWTVADLAGHLGSVHLWVTSILATRVVQDDGGPPALPDDELAGWYADAAGALRAALAATDPDEPCWGLGPPPRVAGFWHRRQVHETAIHLWDLSTSLGAPEPVAVDVAEDAVDEAVTVMAPRQVRLGRIAALTDAVRLVSHASGRTWELGEGVGGKAATVTADPDVLALLLWRRVGLDDPQVTVEGDRAAAVRTFAVALTP